MILCGSLSSLRVSDGKLAVTREKFPMTGKPISHNCSQLKSYLRRVSKR